MRSPKCSDPFDRTDLSLSNDIEPPFAPERAYKKLAFGNPSAVRGVVANAWRPELQAEAGLLLLLIPQSGPDLLADYVAMVVSAPAARWRAKATRIGIG